jgi:CheY-like chemotaxis protein
VTDEEPGISVLVVEDDEDMRELVRASLENAGIHVVEEAVDGLEALFAVERLDPPPVPTVIVLDNMLPVLTGLNVAERVLQQFPDQRIILFSAFLTPEIRERAKAIGISACASKSELERLPALIIETAEGGPAH